MSLITNHQSSAEMDGALLARSMSGEKLKFYLKVAQSSVSESILAILCGCLFAAFGLALQPLLRWAIDHHLTKITAPIPYGSGGVWVAQIIFTLIGGYLIIQGLICLKEARVQSSALRKALRLTQKEGNDARPLR